MQMSSAHFFVEEQWWFANNHQKYKVSDLLLPEVQLDHEQWVLIFPLKTKLMHCVLSGTDVGKKLRFLCSSTSQNYKTPALLTRVGYRSHLNRYQYRYRYLEFSTGTQRYLFSVLYSLCNNINIYFSEKISPKLSISIFWTIGPYNFFSSRNFCFIFF